MAGDRLTKSSGKESRAKRFFDIYATNEWNSSETRSGRGSDISATRQVVRIIDAAIIVTKSRVFLDAGAGERHWLGAVRAPVERYYAVDIVPALTSSTNSARNYPRHWPRPDSICADIICDTLPHSDLILCRDVLPHFSFEDAFRALGNMRASGAEFLLTTTFANRENTEIETGRWRPLNLEAPPFNLPPPAKRWDELCPLDGGKYSDKCLNLWRFDELVSI